MKESEIKPGYVYHIKDTYFEEVKDDKLMRNQEGGAYHPTYLCLKDDNTGLSWVVTMSRRIDKLTSVTVPDFWVNDTEYNENNCQCHTNIL